MSDNPSFTITADSTPEPEQSPTPSRNRKRTAAVSAGVLASGVALVGGSALFLGSANAAPATHANTAVSLPKAVSKAAAAKALARAAAPVAETPGQKAADDFYAKGYTYDDAVALAKTWNLADAWSAKVKGGTELEAGQALPIAPGSSVAAPAAPEAGDAAVTEFFAKGYTFDDAVKLSAIWHTTDPYQAKIMGGTKLAAGQTLPIAP